MGYTVNNCMLIQLLVQFYIYYPSYRNISPLECHIPSSPIPHQFFSNKNDRYDSRNSPNPMPYVCPSTSYATCLYTYSTSNCYFSFCILRTRCRSGAGEAQSIHTSDSKHMSYHNTLLYIFPGYIADLYYKLCL